MGEKQVVKYIFKNKSEEFFFPEYCDNDWIDKAVTLFLWLKVLWKGQNHTLFRFQTSVRK